METWRQIEGEFPESKNREGRSVSLCGRGVHDRAKDSGANSAIENEVAKVDWSIRVAVTGAGFRRLRLDSAVSVPSGAQAGGSAAPRERSLRAMSSAQFRVV